MRFPGNIYTRFSNPNNNEFIEKALPDGRL